MEVRRGAARDTTTYSFSTWGNMTVRVQRRRVVRGDFPVSDTLEVTRLGNFYNGAQ